MLWGEVDQLVHFVTCNHDCITIYSQSHLEAHGPLKPTQSTLSENRTVIDYDFSAAIKQRSMTFTEVGICCDGYRIVLVLYVVRNIEGQPEKRQTLSTEPRAKARRCLVNGKVLATAQRTEERVCSCMGFDRVWGLFDVSHCFLEVNSGCNTNRRGSEAGRHMDFPELTRKYSAHRIFKAAESEFATRLEGSSVATSNCGGRAGLTVRLRGIAIREIPLLGVKSRKVTRAEWRLESPNKT